MEHLNDVQSRYSTSMCRCITEGDGESFYYVCENVYVCTYIPCLSNSA